MKKLLSVFAAALMATLNVMAQSEASGVPYLITESDDYYVEIVLDGMNYNLVPSDPNIVYYYYGGPTATQEGFEARLLTKLSELNGPEELGYAFMQGEQTHAIPPFWNDKQMNVFVAAIVWNPDSELAEIYRPTKLVYSPAYGSTQQVVARVGEMMYVSIAEAMENLGDGETLRILSDIDMGSDALEFGVNAKIDLNGHTLTSSNENGTVYAPSSNVSVVGTGLIENTSEEKVACGGNVSVAGTIEVVGSVPAPAPTPTAITDDDIVKPAKTVKTISDGKVVIIKNGVKYDITGRKL